MPRGRGASGRVASDRIDGDREFERVDIEMDTRRLLRVCVMPMALLLVAGAARAQTQEQHPGGAPPDSALELPAGEPLDLSPPEPEEFKAIRPLSEQPVASPWDSKVGIDYHKPSIPATNSQPEQRTAGAVPYQSAGVAWATVAAPGFGSALGWDQTAIETRVDPAQ